MNSIFFAYLFSQNDNRVLPPVPPKPPKRGILKGPRLSITSVTEEINISSPDSSSILIRNTLQNELMSYQLKNNGSGSLSSENLLMEIEVSFDYWRESRDDLIVSRDLIEKFLSFFLVSKSTGNIKQSKHNHITITKC